METENKVILQLANECVSRGDYEGFLEYCTDDVVWHFVGDQILKGSDAVLNYMKENYLAPPQVEIRDLIAEDDSLIAIGEITLKNEHNGFDKFAYSDIWRFRDGKMSDLRAFVISLEE